MPEIAYDDREARRALGRLRAAGRDLTPVMRRIAGHFADSVAESFEHQAKPGAGRPWKPLKDATILGASAGRPDSRHRAAPLAGKPAYTGSRLMVRAHD